MGGPVNRGIPVFNSDFPSFEGYSWDLLRGETARLRECARDLGIYLVLGSAHFLDEKTKPTNCLYLIDPKMSWTG